MDLFLGIDVGTSATKAVACDRTGRVIAERSEPHEISRPFPGYSEQDPEQWWVAAAAACSAITSALARTDRVVAVGFSGQMHGSVLLDRDALTSGGSTARALRPAILWNDQRTGEQCAQIERSAGGREKLVELVGNAALPGFTLPKMLWVRQHEPAIWKKTAAVLLPKDYVRLRLTGNAATDVGDASGVLLLDVDRRCWSAAAARTLGADLGVLPPVIESAQIAGRVSAWAAKQTGLVRGTPVVAGSGDNMMGAVGAGVVSPGMVVATTGTSGVIYAHADAPRRDRAGRLHTMCAATGPDGWCITGCMLSAGGALAWARDVIAPGVSYDELMAEAARAPIGSGGLVFLPYLTGERCPYADPQARGGWIGLTSRHTRGHLVRAVIEGVTFGLAQILDLVRAAGVPVRRVRLGGGGARSELWRTIQADAFNAPCAMTNTQEGPALGAAILGAVGVGVFTSVSDACAQIVRETSVVEPDAARVEQYAKIRAVYGGLYERLKPDMHELAERDA